MTAHLIVIPTGQTKDDLRPAVKLAHSLVDSGIDSSRIAFALVKTTRSAAEIAAARTYLEQTDYTLIEGFLPVSTAYGIAHDAGKGFWCRQPTGIGDNEIWRIVKRNGILYLPDVGSKTTSFFSAFAGISASN